MGLFNFIKSAGRLLGIGGAHADTTQDESKAAPPPPAADAIRAELQRVGLPADAVQVQVEGDRVKMSGTAPDAETREKMILAAGNVAGIAGVDESLTLAGAASAPDPTFYTVVKGDTLSAISKKQYGDANQYTKIFEANRPMLSDPNKIYPGQVLRIPPQAA